MSHTTDMSGCERVSREIKSMNLTQLSIVRRMVLVEYERRQKFVDKWERLRDKPVG